MMTTDEIPHPTTRIATRTALIWLIVAGIIAIVGGWWLWANRVPANTLAARTQAAPAVGHPAPDFTLNILEGGTLTLSDLRGTPVVLNFWATWCGPCRNEMPALQQTADRYGERVRILGVDQAEDPAIVQAFLDELGIDFTVPLDADQSVSTLYNVNGLPTTYFIDAEGVIRQLWMGEMNTITLEEGVAKLIQ